MKVSKNRALALSLIGFAMIALLDVTTTYHVSFLLLHLLPILFVTWYAGATWGVVLSLSMTIVQMCSSIYDGVGDSASINWYLDIASDLGAALLLVWMQSRLKKSFDHVNRLARHDRLTECLNRTGFYDALESEFNRAKRYPTRFSLIYFDCDNFKQVNDTLGHHVGDKLLARVGVILRGHVRQVDSVSRLGGDEFAILLPEAAQTAAYQTITHLRDQLDSAMKAMKWPVTFSIGVATFDTVPETIDKALEMVDGLMYEVKRSGKNNIVFRSF
ncbi:GGDEF domain-containing protein [Noviherbaspirillum aerium]|uniref:GGDEF domain-containing protein n=1 Tax=Noviherbaspirillum aerium TaxID=2588497 RepID=UPI00124C2C28|nr:GGDEF domain-containing protein [Noviherbaspirillum aerium]